MSRQLSITQLTWNFEDVIAPPRPTRVTLALPILFISPEALSVYQGVAWNRLNRLPRNPLPRRSISDVAWNHLPNHLP